MSSSPQALSASPLASGAPFHHPFWYNTHMKRNPMNVIEKILSRHLVEGDPAKDAEIGIRIDQTLTQDATGTMAYLQFESMDVPRVKNDLAVSYVDHNTVQIGFENSDDHDFLASVAKKYGIVYS